MKIDLFRRHGDPEPQPPDIGDVILTKRKAKLVTAMRPIESREWPHRFHIDASNIGSGRRDDPAVVAEVERLVAAGAKAHEFVRYTKGETAQQFARTAGYEVER